MQTGMSQRVFHGAGCLHGRGRHARAIVSLCAALLAGAALAQSEAPDQSAGELTHIRGLRASSPEQALVAVNALLAKDPHNPEALAERVYVLKARGNYEAAVAAFEPALRADPGNLYLIRARAQARLALGDNAGALADMDRVVDATPEGAQGQARVERAWLKFAAGQANAAVKDLLAVMQEARVRKDGITIISAYHTYADISFVQGNFRRAADAYQGEIATSLTEQRVNAETFRRMGTYPFSENSMGWMFIAEARVAGKAPGEKARHELKNTAARLRYPGSDISSMNTMLLNSRAATLTPDIGPYGKRLASVCQGTMLLGQWQMLYGSHVAAQDRFADALRRCEPGSMAYLVSRAELDRMQARPSANLASAGENKK